MTTREHHEAMIQDLTKQLIDVTATLESAEADRARCADAHAEKRRATATAEDAASHARSVFASAPSDPARAQRDRAKIDAEDANDIELPFRMRLATAEDTCASLTAKRAQLETAIVTASRDREYFTLLEAVDEATVKATVAVHLSRAIVALRLVREELRAVDALRLAYASNARKLAATWRHAVPALDWKVILEPFLRDAIDSDPRAAATILDRLAELRHPFAGLDVASQSDTLERFILAPLEHFSGRIGIRNVSPEVAAHALPRLDAMLSGMTFDDGRQALAELDARLEQEQEAAQQNVRREEEEAAIASHEPGLMARFLNKARKSFGSPESVERIDGGKITR